MRNTSHLERIRHLAGAMIMTTATVAGSLGHLPARGAGEESKTTVSAQHLLSQKQRSIAPIAAAMAVGNLPQLNAALARGLDAGLTVNDAKEVLVQLYAYTGFPRSLNALGELMKLVETRKQRGITDAVGREPAPIPKGNELLVLGTDNQTKLLGAPVKGPLFEFAPAIDDFLKRHLFGDIFARDNLDWQSRELATVGALAAMPGVESQLRSHIAISLNVGLTAAQLHEVAGVLADAGQPDAARRTRAALEQHLAGPAR